MMHQFQFHVYQKKSDVNSSVVYSRIKRLVKRKLIERFTIVVNDAELGYDVKALTGINMRFKKTRSHVIEELFKIDGVREIAEVTGRFDILSYNVFKIIRIKCIKWSQNESVELKEFSPQSHLLK